MSTYICENCGCIDNTACGGNYWNVVGKMKLYKDDFANEKLLCVECTPIEYSDGSRNSNAGKWHEKFPKKHWMQYGTETEIITECEKGIGNVVNAKEYFKNIK